MKQGGGGTGNAHLHRAGGGRLNHSGLSGGGQADGLRSLQTTGREQMMYGATNRARRRI